jgi:hypothetical protein
MQQLGKVQTQTTWAKASDTINNNSEKLYEAITQVENKVIKNKGYFSNYDELYRTYRGAEDGAQAFVYNAGNDPSTPYDIYGYIDGEWIDTSLNGGSTSVNLSTKQDLLKGYRESVNNDDDVEELSIWAGFNGNACSVFMDGTIGEMNIRVHKDNGADYSRIDVTPTLVAITTDELSIDASSVSLGDTIPNLEAYIVATKDTQDEHGATLDEHTQTLETLRSNITTSINNSAPSAPITDITTIL